MINFAILQLWCQGSRLNYRSDSTFIISFYFIYFQLVINLLINLPGISMDLYQSKIMRCCCIMLRNTHIVYKNLFKQIFKSYVDLNCCISASFLICYSLIFYQLNEQQFVTYWYWIQKDNMAYFFHYNINMR